MSETWIIESSDNQRIIYIKKEGAPFGEKVAIIYDGNMEHAHLIKAAPKMRDALEFVESYLSRCAGNDPDALAYLHRAQDAMDAADGEDGIE